MAANDAWELQGMNGGVAVTTGQTFTGVSRGVLCALTGDAGVDLVNPRGAAVTITLTAYPTGVRIDGPITSVAPSSGIWIVYPTSTDYTVV